MGRLLILILFITGSVSSYAATCTITVSANWNACTCSQTGSAPVPGDSIVVSSGVTVTITTNPAWTGPLVIFGTVINNKANALWDANIRIMGTGDLELNDKLDIGNGAGCGPRLYFSSGGQLHLNGSGGSDLLSICDVKVAQSGGGCGPFPTGPLPFCEPTGPPSGFYGPLILTPTGFAPIELLYFNVSVPKNEKHIVIEWATADEKNFDHFEIQRAGSDLDFRTIAELDGAGYNTNSVKKYSAYDENPMIGAGYYRLKAVDIDGSYEYFRVKSVNYTGGRELLVWANPASGNSFKYSVNFEPGTNDRVTLVNQLGAEVYSMSVTGTENEMIPDSRLKPGIYMLRYYSNDFKGTARVFIKE